MRWNSVIIQYVSNDSWKILYYTTFSVQIPYTSGPFKDTNDNLKNFHSYSIFLGFRYQVIVRFVIQLSVFMKERYYIPFHFPWWIYSNQNLFLSETKFQRKRQIRDWRNQSGLSAGEIQFEDSYFIFFFSHLSSLRCKIRHRAGRRIFSPNSCQDLKFPTT